MSFKNKGRCLECGAEISKGEPSCLCDQCYTIENDTKAQLHGTPTDNPEPVCKFPLCSGNIGSPCYMDCFKEPAVDVKLRNPKGVAAKAKVSVGLVPEIAVIELAQAFRSGAVKYGPMNWRDEPIATSVYLDAIERHLLRYRAGEDIDPESGLSHVTHIMSGCAILLDGELQGTLIDDRMKMKDPSVIGTLLERYRQANEA